MLLPRVALLWHTVLSSAMEDSENLSPLAKNILATLSSSGNAVMRRDIGHGPPVREDSDLRHRVLELTSLGHLADARLRQDPDELAEDELGSLDSLEETPPPESETTGEPLEETTESIVETTEEPSSTTRITTAAKTTKASTATTTKEPSSTTRTGNTTETTPKPTTATTSGTSSTTQHSNATTAAPTTTTTTTKATATTTTTKASTTAAIFGQSVQFTTTHSPAHLQAVEVGVAAAAAARAEGLSPEQQAARAGEAAAAAAEAAGLSPLEVVKVAGHAASAAAKALGLPADQQVQAAVLAAEIASQQAQLSAEQEATAAAGAALYAAQAAGLSRQEQGVVFSQVVTSVRKGLQDALAFKIKEMHAASHPAPVKPPPPPEQGFRDQIKEMIEKLAEQVSATSARLENVEKHNRQLSDELAADKAEEPLQGTTEPPEGELPEKHETKGGEAPTSQVKIPGHMNANEPQTYWTKTEPSRALEKPVHPHNVQEALMTAEEVAALSPDQVASILTLNRELLAAVTRKLSSGEYMSSSIFDTDASNLPSNPPTEKALDAIMQHPDLAKKALNLTLTILGRGVRKLNSGKALADELFGSDTSHLIAQEVKTKTLSEEASGTDDSVTDGEEAGAKDDPEESAKAPKGAKEQEGSEGTPGAPASGTTTTQGETEGGTKVLGIELPSGLFNFLAFWRWR